MYRWCTLSKDYANKASPTVVEKQHEINCCGEIGCGKKLVCNQMDTFVTGRFEVMPGDCPRDWVNKYPKQSSYKPIPNNHRWQGVSISDPVEKCAKKCISTPSCDAFAKYQGDDCYMYNLKDEDIPANTSRFTGGPIEGKCYIKQYF